MLEPLFPESSATPWRRDFPALNAVGGEPAIAYLDSAATALKPQSVLDAMSRYHHNYCANIHRAVHRWSEEATAACERARSQVARFLKTHEPRSVVWTSGTTGAINMIARGLEPLLRRGDQIVLTEIEHHSNLVPWQMLARRCGAEIVVWPLRSDHLLHLDDLESVLTARTRVLSMTCASNVLGTITPFEEAVALARRRRIWTVLDGAQFIPHRQVQVDRWGCDFFAFSGHKVYGPTGIGVLWGRMEALEQLDPLFGGGSMIRTVTMQESTFADLPARLEAGTPHVAGILGLGAALEYLESAGMTALATYEDELLRDALAILPTLPGVQVLGALGQPRVPVLSFDVRDIHPHDLGTLLDQRGVAIRTGHHCAQPLMKHLNRPATARASLAFYNSREDLEHLVNAIQYAQGVMKV